MRIVSFLILTAVLALFTATFFLPEMSSAEEAKKDAGFKYIGEAGCKFCHAGPKNGNIYETWKASDHAKAFEKLGAEAQKNEACLGCHTTGHGKTVAAGKTTADLQGVQCEACHGPGSEYKAMNVMKDTAQATAKGLITPAKPLCEGCHTASLPKECWAGAAAAPKFDFAVAVKKIEHKVPEKPAAK
jgi:hypothetical protein